MQCGRRASVISAVRGPCGSPECVPLAQVCRNGNEAQVCELCTQCMGSRGHHTSASRSVLVQICVHGGNYQQRGWGASDLRAVDGLEALPICLVHVYQV